MGQGGYGNLDQFDPQRMLMQRGLNYGMGLANSAAEGLFLGLMESPYGGAKARFNFMVDWDGKINGEGDLLLPWYDSKYTTVYSQFGARTMNAEDSRDRWIGNFGLGIEGQYDWLHLASNYYFPLSSWKGSEDFDSNFVKERAAEGWDIRAKGYLPFYRNVAVTGAYTQWYGDNVGMFGASRLEKDPKVWSYGLEYTPIPLVSGFVNQRSTERGRSDTELGLRFTYHLQMPWEDQIRHDKVAQLRTVGGSRHEFVDRENRIILEYKAKNNYHIEYLAGSSNPAAGQFVFRIRNGFDKYPTGTMVRVTPSGTQFAEAPAAPKSFFAQAVDVLDDLISTKAAYAAELFRSFPVRSDGTILVTGFANSALLTGLTVQAGEASRTFTAAELAELGNAASGYDITLTSGYQASLTQGSTMTLVYTVSMQGVSTPAPDGTAVTLLAQTQGGSTTAQKLMVASGTVAGGSGQVSLVFNGGSGSTQDSNAFLARKVVLYGKVGSTESSASSVVTVGTIPAGNGGSYLTGVSVTRMNWGTAKNYCISHGGTLPLVNSSTSQSYAQVTSRSTATISGTGTINTSAWNTPWSNTGLPSDGYWSGTEFTDFSGASSWLVYGLGGHVNAGYDFRSFGRRAVCVP